MSGSDNDCDDDDHKKPYGDDHKNDDDDDCPPVRVLDGVVEGTSGSDLINAAYLGDPDGDRIDNNDAILPGEAPQDDIVRAFGGDDTVYAGLGNDDVYGGDGNDTVYGGAGNDLQIGRAHV